MASRIYVVTDTQASGVSHGHQLVRASSQAQAVNAVVSDRYGVAVASQDDIVALLQDGGKVLEAKSETLAESAE